MDWISFERCYGSHQRDLFPSPPDDKAETQRSSCKRLDADMTEPADDPANLADIRAGDALSIPHQHGRTASKGLQSPITIPGPSSCPPPPPPPGSAARGSTVVSLAAINFTAVLSPLLHTRKNVEFS